MIASKHTKTKIPRFLNNNYVHTYVANKKPYIDPFKAQPLPKAHYIPTRQKKLLKETSKTSIAATGSPHHGHPSQDIDGEVENDNAPTIANSSVKNDEGYDHGDRSSQFDESWPTSGRPTSSYSNVVIDEEDAGRHVSRSSRVDAPQTGVEILPHSDYDPSDGSVLSKYIQRFRTGIPMSRDRRREADAIPPADFWWLSTSPTRDAPAKSLPQNTVRCQSPRGTPSGRQQLLDESTHRLQEKAQQLLVESEKSWISSEVCVSTDGLGSTPDSSYSQSTEPFTRPAFTKVFPSEKRVPQSYGVGVDRNFPQSAVPIRPQDDILYQWRLRRKMEIARNATASHPDGTTGRTFTGEVKQRSVAAVGSHQPRVSTRTHDGGEFVETVPASRGSGSPRSGGRGLEEKLMVEEVRDLSRIDGEMDGSRVGDSVHAVERRGHGGGDRVSGTVVEGGSAIEIRDGKFMNEVSRRDLVSVSGDTADRSDRVNSVERENNTLRGYNHSAEIEQKEEGHKRVCGGDCSMRCYVNGSDVKCTCFDKPCKTCCSTCCRRPPVCGCVAVCEMRGRSERGGSARRCCRSRDKRSGEMSRHKVLTAERPGDASVWESWGDQKCDECSGNHQCDKCSENQQCDKCSGNQQCDKGSGNQLCDKGSNIGGDGDGDKVGRDGKSHDGLLSDRVMISRPDGKSDGCDEQDGGDKKYGRVESAEVSAVKGDIVDHKSDINVRNSEKRVKFPKPRKSIGTGNLQVAKDTRGHEYAHVPDYAHKVQNSLSANSSVASSDVIINRDVHEYSNDCNSEPANKTGDSSMLLASGLVNCEAIKTVGASEINKAIGQVVGGRLFDLTHASLDDLSDLTSISPLLSINTQASLIDEESDGEFAHDPLLSLLRKQRASYEQQLRNIDDLLSDLELPALESPARS